MPAKFHPDAISSESNLSRIEGFYTQAILSGRLKEGERLPPSDEIARIWSASGTVVQKAMQRLAAAGLVERVRRSGTVVRPRQERAVVGMIFGSDVGEATAASQRLLVHHIEKRLSEKHLACRVYAGVNLNDRKSADVLQLLRSDLVYYSFKGIVTMYAGESLPKELLKADLPRVDVSNQESEVRLDRKAMIRDILAFLKARGRKRVTLLAMHGREPMPWREETNAAFRAEAAEQGLTLEVLPAETDRRGFCFEVAAFNTIGAWAAEWKRKSRSRADAMVMLDEVAARGACMALLKAQIESLRDLDIVVRGSDSVDIFYGMPVHSFKVPIAPQADAMVELLWRRMTKMPLPELPIFVQGRLVPYEG